MRPFVNMIAILILLNGVTGCSYLFYPRADEYHARAKGSTGVETLMNLTAMLEVSAQTGKEGMGHDQTLNDLHNQLHALEDAFCDVTEEQAKTPAYALAVTHKKELWVIFKRTWR